jgi:signal transduction histidine kinase
VPAKLLFVDDDEENLIVCEAHCERDFDVLTCTGADRALELLIEHEIGVIIADQRMPGTSGVELLERVRIEHPDVVRLLITAYSDVTAAIAAINRGQVRRYIRKPWDPNELRAELKDALEIYEMSRKLRSLSVRLRETERVYSLGIIAASVAHELSNPVTWLHDGLRHVKSELSKLEQQVQGATPNPEVTARIRSIEDALDDAQVGAQRILEIVRGIELPNRQRDSLEIVDLDGVIELSLKLVAGELRGAATVIYEPQLRPHVRASQTKVSQIVLNLVINAIQAMEGLPKDKSLIKLKVTTDDAWVYLSVSDSGEGVPPSWREKVFDPFFTTKQKQGTGLGLAICHQIAVDLGGSLRVEDDPELGGARFVLQLPLVP